MTDLPTELRDAAGDGSFTHTAFTPATLLVRAADALDDAAEIDDIATAMVEWSTAQARRIDKLCAETEQQRAWLANCHADKARYSAIIDRQRAIIEGRTTPPTDAEIEAHAAAGGKWWVFARWNRGGAEKSANVIHSWAPGVARYLRDGQPDARWWALDASWAPCAWPEVSDGR